MAEHHNERHTPAEKSFLEKAAVVVAPSTVILGLFYYLGRTRITAYYSELGVSVSELGLSSQDYLLSSPGAVFFPLWILLVAGLVVFLVYEFVDRRLSDPAARGLRRRTYRVAGAVGGVMLVVAFSVPYLGGDWYKAPLLGVVGAVLALFGLALKRDGARAFAAGHGHGRDRLWAVVGAVLIVMLTLSVFSGVAWWADHEGAAQARRESLSDKTWVNVYTTHRVFGKPDLRLAKQYEPFRNQYWFCVLATSSSRYYLAHREPPVRKLYIVRRDDPTMRVEVVR
ncbi:hypothetical protein ACZ90_15765 [Streptomyces albus subsp. albus]|nr:hypothetical protein ACZ90_15765 [Streptomyces albus subsp. albus]